MKKLWEKSTSTTLAIEEFTTGNDRLTDLFLAPFDVIGSMAHITMLCKVGLLTQAELHVLLSELKAIYQRIENGNFVIESGVEDVHSQIELLLTQKLGEAGKKIHSGRSRNDQVLLDLKLFARCELEKTVVATDVFLETLLAQSEKYKHALLPGYTHLQVAMPSSFGLWFGAYAESLADDLQMLLAAWKIVNRNPLGSAAGYGSSFPLDRQMTTDLLGFDTMNYNSIYAQMGRGKMERTVTMALAAVAATLSKLAFDACLFNSQNFAFITLPAEYTTGSSIMPHKKNPDVFELIRAKCNKIQSLPNQLLLITNNLPSGYFRDLQITKDIFIPAFDEILQCLRIATQMLVKIEINEHILDDSRYDLIFSVEEVNRRVIDGTPFRDAYRQTGLEIEQGKFQPNKNIAHTHQGSIGNLCNKQIADYKNNILEQFNFENIHKAEIQLLESL
ncbi:MAG: argininosuccinate lyase [Paludibacter sp.]|jgi:argininosuccinate lyase|nr:argininosuccinate lyase [Paludibacter sp.]